MKLKEGFILREVAGEHVVLCTSAEMDLNGMLTLNSTGRTLWCALEQDVQMSDLTQALLDEYEVDEQTARAAAAAFVDKLKELDLLA